MGGGGGDVKNQPGFGTSSVINFYLGGIKWITRIIISYLEV
jgi:hypothetical protein